jgi:TetR/AcrR family fatty acid metabolism transcriptional regulator
MEVSESTGMFRGTSKRDRILRAAVEVFAQTGYHTSKVAEVAKQAGVADGTIYLYFLGKEDLLITIFREHTQQFLEDLKIELAAADGAEERIRALIRHHLTALGGDRSLAVVFQVELRQSLKFMSLFSKTELADYLNIIRATVEEGQSAGTFKRKVHPQLAAKAIFGMMDEMVTSWVLSEKEYLPEKNAEQLSEMIIGGLS